MSIGNLSSFVSVNDVVGSARINGSTYELKVKEKDTTHVAISDDQTTPKIEITLSAGSGSTLAATIKSLTATSSANVTLEYLELVDFSDL